MRLYFALMAVLFAAGAVALFVRRWSVASGGITVSGKVVAFEQREDDDSIHYLPVVTFADHLGRTHRFTSVAGSSEQHPPIGSSVAVRYLPANPDHAFIVSFLHMWAAPLGMLVLAGCCLLAYIQW